MSKSRGVDDSNMGEISLEEMESDLQDTQASGREGVPEGRPERTASTGRQQLEKRQSRALALKAPRVGRKNTGLKS